MADVVLGIGSSHGPLLSTPPEQWDLRAKADKENKNHWFRGKTYDYPALLQEKLTAAGYKWRVVNAGVPMRMPLATIGGF